MIVFLFLTSVLVLILTIPIKAVIVKRIQLWLKRIFNKALYYEKGKTLISFVNLLGEGNRLKLKSSLIEVSFNFFPLFTSHSFKHAEIKIIDLDLELLETDKSEHPRPKTTIDQWIKQKILVYILILITRSAKLQLQNITVRHKGNKYNFQSIVIEFDRASNEFTLNIVLNGISYSKFDPCAHIPHFSISFKGSLESLRQFLSNFYRNFGIKIPALNIHFNDGQFAIDECDVMVNSPNDADVDAKITMDKINLLLPVLDLHTKRVDVMISEISMGDDVIEVNKLHATRGKQLLCDIPTIKMDRNTFSFAHVDLFISSTLLIDIGLLHRFFYGVSNPFEKTREKSRTLQRIYMKAPTVNLTLAFSDNHVIKLPMKKVVYHDKEISAKSFKIDIVFPHKTFTFFTARWAELNLVSPNFALKAREAEFTLHSDLAEKSFINETFSIISWLSKQMKGDRSAFRDKLPPTSKKFSFLFESGAIKYTTSKLTDEISISNVAKLEAMQQLKIRQEKALNILKARGSKIFDENLYESESKDMLFKLYREAWQKLPEPDIVLYSVPFKDLEFIIDGPALPNREAALEKLVVIDKHLEKDDVGRIFGGALTFNAKHMMLNTRHSGTIMTLDDVKTSGWYINAKKKGVTRSDFFHYRITCDDGFDVFDIPSIACRAVQFFDFNMDSTKIVMKFVPDWSEIRQDWKLGSTLWRTEKYKYKRVYMFDKYRLRYRWLFKISAKDFIIQKFDLETMYTQTPNINFILPDFAFSFDRRQFTIVASQFLIRAQTSHGLRSLATFPAPNMTVRIVSHNPHNVDARRPTFIPIDSYRLTDPEYEPYMKYCSHTYSVHSTIDFGDGFLVINGDLLKQFIHTIIHKGSPMARYVKPTDYIRRTSTYPRFSFFDVSVMIPKLMMTLSGDKIRVKLTGDPLILKMSTDGGFKVTCTGNKSELYASFCERKLCYVTATHIDVATKDAITAKVRSITGEITTEALSHLNEFVIELPPPKKKNPLPMMTNEQDLLNHFTTTKFIIELAESKMTLLLTDNEASCSLTMQNMMFEKRKNDTQTSLNILRIDNIDLNTHAVNPLFHLEKVSFLNASGLQNAMKLFNIQQMAVNFRPDDFDVFVPAIQAYSLKINNEDDKANKIAGRNSLISGSISKIDVKFHHPEGHVMCIINLTSPNIYYLANIDNSAVINFQLQSFSAIDDTSLNPFREIFSCTSEQMLVDLRMKRAKRIMKRPVFERIKCKIAPFSAAISMPFIKNLIAIFPSADELRALDIDQDDIDENQDSSMQDGIPPPNIEAAESEGAFFCREFILHQFSANLNFRRKETGTFKEFLDRSFTYQGLHMYDIFGTKNQLMAYIKKNLKWTLIKALPGFILSKGKKAQNTTNTSLPKPKDMEN